MIIEYINTALAQAHYELIDDEEPYYGEIPDLPGVFATGKTLEECRKNLMEVVDGWLIIRLRRGMSIPSIQGISIEEIQPIDTHVRA
ncbi:type II toxin-antitoxin system HicB family antitoxin [Methanospirillum lacunae]|uniref:HicB family protein n=1 Tax=Methanospirillum lacunae TaxID=668570 RepID=A0A2V2ND15_9EURY|nr:type II toxin-antitoxin system HicB family antitoxin [Methanospirillum lacunae]PWR74247.1 HicB family protein [Methanospirillum lacunae]